MEIVLLTSRRRGLPVIFLQKILQEPSISLKAVVFSHNERNKINYLNQKFRKVLKQGISILISGFYLRDIFRESAYLECNEDLNEFCKLKNIHILEIKRTVNLSIEDRSKLTDLTFDVGISIGNSFLGKKILSLPRSCFINIHHELLPEFKGAQSIIWQFYQKSSVSGFTLHEMNNKIDDGAILMRKEIPIKIYPTFKETIRRNLKYIKLESINALISLLKTNSMNYIKVETKEGHYTTPNLAQLIKIINNYKVMRSEFRSKE